LLKRVFSELRLQFVASCNQREQEGFHGSQCLSGGGRIAALNDQLGNNNPLPAYKAPDLVNMSACADNIAE
jgi:hypothetical protein